MSACHSTADQRLQDSMQALLLLDDSNWAPSTCAKGDQAFCREAEDALERLYGQLKKAIQVRDLFACPALRESDWPGFACTLLSMPRTGRGRAPGQKGGGWTVLILAALGGACTAAPCPAAPRHIALVVPDLPPGGF